MPFWSVPAHIFETSEWNTITFGSQNLAEKVCYCQSLPWNLVWLGASYSVYWWVQSLQDIQDGVKFIWSHRCSILICHPFDCCKRGYVVLGLSNSSSGLGLFWARASLDHRDPIRPQPRVLTHSCISFVMCFGIRKRPLSTGWQFLSSGRLACDWSDSVEFEQRSWNLSFEQRSWNLSFQSRPKLKRRLEIRTARLKSFQSWLK